MRWLRAALAPLQRSPFGVLVAAETFVALRTRRLWWWAAWAPVFGVQLFGGPHAVALAMLAGWTLLLDAFSRAGLREREYRTAELVLTSRGAAPRLLGARGAMLVGLAWAASAPGVLRELSGHPAMAGTALAIGASLALWGLAGAALTRSSRPFELVFLVAAYATTQGLPWLDASAHGHAVPAAHAIGIALALAITGARGTALLRRDAPG